MGAPYIYDISRLRVKDLHSATYIYVVRRLRVKVGISLFALCGYISSSVGSQMSRSLYPVIAERSFVSCNLIIWSWLMLCSANADLSVCASRVCLLCSLILIWIDRLLCPI